MLTVSDTGIADVVVEHGASVVCMSDCPEEGGCSDTADWIEGRCWTIWIVRVVGMLPGGHGEQ